MTSAGTLFARACRHRGVEPPPSIRLRGVDDGGAQPVTPDDLGPAHERDLAEPDRRRRGAWYTPPSLARELVGRAVLDPGVVVDPACGGGVFLLAAADRLRALGVSVREAVGLLRGADIDAAALAVAKAAVWLWSVDHGEPTEPGTGQFVTADVLDRSPWPPSSAAAVVGNPPFRGQLRSRTAVDGDDRDRLRDRFGTLVQPYTDPAWLFLAAAVELVAPAGRVCLVQPQSLLSARDAGPVRDHLDRTAPPESCWIGSGGEFAAAVDVCAPLLIRGGPVSWRWGDAAATSGVPSVDLDDSGPVLGDLASVTPGFRQDYYALVDRVVDDADGDGPRLVTTGAIDPFTCRWGSTPIRFSKRSWTHPRVEPGPRTPWTDAQVGRPKLLVATQTKVIEACADPIGDLVAGIPAIPVVPHDPADLDRLAAALHAPPVAAWARRRSVGSGLSAAAMRVTGPLLASIPLPSDADAWAEASRLGASISTGSSDDWDAFALAASAAYGVHDPAIVSWWHSQRPIRSAVHRF